MFPLASKAIVLCFLFILSGPLLYAQNDPILFKIAPLPEKESIKDVLPYTLTLFPEKELINIAVPILPTYTAESVKIIPLTETRLALREQIDFHDYNKIFLAAALLPQIDAGQNISSLLYNLKTSAFLDFIDKAIYEDKRFLENDKKSIRQDWEFFFGIDIWYPYFKAKEIENWVCDRTNIELFDFKGRIKFEKNQIRYTFRMKF